MLLPESLRILELQARGLCILKPWDGSFAVWGSWVARVHGTVGASVAGICIAQVEKKLCFGGCLGSRD